MLYLTVEDFRREHTGWHWPHFSPEELACKCGGKYCGGEYFHDPEFLDALEALRADVGRPLVINSGHRCEGHNAAVGGAVPSKTSPGSMHLKIATDISLRGHDRHKLRDKAISRGFTGRGYGRTFLHLDRRKATATWFYGDSANAW